MSSSSNGVAMLWPVMFIVFDLLLLVSVAMLVIAQTSQVARNVTTNELANWHRYRYLHDAQGEFFNPFDHGWKTNCVEVCVPHKAKQAPYVLEQGRSASLHGNDREGLLKEQAGRSTAD